MDSSEKSQARRVHIWVKGRVQGVGFRAHVEYYARIMGVCGWVRNVGWDTVEAVAEGTQDVIDQFIELVRTGPQASRVDEFYIEEEEPAESNHEFMVKYSV